VPLCVLLAVTIIGIPLIPVAVMLLVALFLFGFTVSAAWLGERLPFPQANTPVKTVALGGVVLALVGLIPWIGTPTLFLAAAFSAGATLLSRFGRTSAVAQQALMVMAAVVAAGTALVPGQALGAEPIELVTLRSGSYADFRQVFTREAPAGVSVPATLRFPDQARDRYPAIEPESAAEQQEPESLPVIEGPEAAEVRMVDVDQWVLPPDIEVLPEPTPSEDSMPLAFIAADVVSPLPALPDQEGPSLFALLEQRSQSVEPRRGRKQRPQVEEQGLLFSLQ